MSITFVLNLFLLQTGAGMLALCVFLPKDRVDRHFFRSISFFALLFLIGGLVLRALYPLRLPESFGISAPSLILGMPFSLYSLANTLYGLLTLAALFAWATAKFSEEKNFRRWLDAAAVLSVAALVCDGRVFTPDNPDIALSVWLVPLHFLTASGVLGGYLLGMIFGHWYLIYTDMPKRLLVRMAGLLAATLAVKGLAVLGTWLQIRYLVTEGEKTWALLSSWQGYGLFFWQRVLIGLAIPAVVTYMIWSTSRIGSNQSATGILYTAVAFIFIGELIAKFLFLFSTIPL